MPVFSDFNFISSNGISKIRSRVCSPDVKPRAVLQIAHGIADHITRYDDFMNYLAENGIICVGNDHLGHGSSVSSPDELGFFNYEKGWSNAVEDMHTLHNIMHEKYASLPYIFFGHSMGSFLTRTYIIDYPDDPYAVILSGTGNQSHAVVNAGLLLSNLIVKKYGAKGNGKLLNDIAFSSYNKKINNPKTEFDWISRDEASVQKYIDDPLCGFIGTNSLYRDMMTGIKYITSESNIKKMKKETPVYFMSGNDDPVGDYGKGVEKAYRLFCDAGLHDVYLKLYDGGRHEMLNEINNKEVYNDILTWINSKI